MTPVLCYGAEYFTPVRAILVLTFLAFCDTIGVRRVNWMQNHANFNIPFEYQELKENTAELDLYLEMTAISEEISKCRARQLA